MTSAETKLAKYARWKAKKPYDDRLTLLYWRYSHQVYGDLNSVGAW
jgi:hypothetical protein